MNESALNPNIVAPINVIDSTATESWKNLHKIFDFFRGASSGASSASSVVESINIFLFIVSVICLFILAYCAVRLIEIRRKEHHHIEHEIAEYAHKQALKEQEALSKQTGIKNEKWNAVLQNVFTDNPGDWRMAIMEADTMLEDLLTSLGYRGENLGEKLKSANKENFRTISYAWEAHLVRNKIAHEGSDFPLSQREAKRVIALYETVFKEFDFV